MIECHPEGTEHHLASGLVSCSRELTRLPTFALASSRMRTSPFVQHGERVALLMSAMMSSSEIGVTESS